MATGLWPILHLTSFMKVTGPKVDFWLVKGFGVLVIVIALPILLAAYYGRPSLEVWTLAVGAAAGLTLIDVWYVSRRVIAPIYLVDAVAEVALIGCWIWLVPPRAVWL
ncbi:MAG: hypothetical protein LC808_06570 [Actinobacteria bacterium]|nr:hypothetical protein [Actinomycetota bacterium]